MRPAMQPFESRRGQIDRVGQMSGRVFKVYGFVDVEGSGEVTWDVQFPVLFIERPALSFGGELGTSQALETGNFPTVSVMVKNWETQKSPDEALIYYKGATLIGVVLGRDAMKATIHWQVEARGLRAPVNDIATTDSAV